MRVVLGGGSFEGSIVYIVNIDFDELDSYKTQLLESLPEALNDKPYHLPEWRSLSEEAKVCFYQLGMLSTEFDENLIAAPFSFNMSEKLWKAASNSKAPDTTYLQHRLKTALKRTLNRVPDFWFAYEVNHSADNTGKPHLHGTMLLKPDEFKKVRDVFHQLNGEVTSDFKKFAIRFSSGKRRRLAKEIGDLQTNLKWALYCTKERATTRHYYLPGQSTTAATRSVTQQAKKYHQQIYNSSKPQDEFASLRNL
ncbi:MAG: hypothetical protein IBX55_21765 [Methyloprofundus sp.]|nr:hypothetical protein [Methyloprofundus sp.]